MNDNKFGIDELDDPDSPKCGEMVNKDLREEPLKEVEEEEAREREDEQGIDVEPSTSKLPEYNPFTPVGEMVNKDLREEPLKEREEEEAREREAEQGIDVEPSELPEYNPFTPVGKDLVVEISAFMCLVCNQLIHSENECELHCRTLSHWGNYCYSERAKKVTEIDPAEAEAEVEQLPPSPSLGTPVARAQPFNSVNRDLEGKKRRKVDRMGDSSESSNDGKWKRQKVNEEDETLEDDITSDTEDDITSNSDDDSSDEDISIVWEAVRR